MRYKKIVEIPTGIVTKISQSMEGRIIVEANGYLKAKYLNWPEHLKPIVI